MYKDKKILCVIPARGGSKGLPGKNIRPLLGKSLIGWTIEQAKASALIDTVIISTDDQQIADVSKQFGATVPFLRPAALASDTSSSIDVIVHALDFLEQEGQSFDYLALLEATSPLRDTKDVDDAIKLLIETPRAASIVGVSKVKSAHPDFLVRLNKMFIDPYVNNDFLVKRRQEIEDLYFFEGSLYISSVNSLRALRSFIHKDCLGFIMPEWKAYEVDDLTDFIIIEALMKAKLEGLLK